MNILIICLSQLVKECLFTVVHRTCLGRAERSWHEALLRKSVQTPPGIGICLLCVCG